MSVLEVDGHLTLFHTGHRFRLAVWNAAALAFLCSATVYLSLKWEPLFVVGLGVALLLAGLVFKNPLYGLILLTAVSFVNTSSVSVLYEISELSLRVQDLLFALLAGALLVKGGITGSLSIPIELTRVFLAALVFISCIALSLLNVYGAFPDHFGYSA
ncbi:MAG: hypothetical protein ACYSWP_18480, partial [Planctomycetota bacterium]